ncbi:hypothetical protein P5673_022217, partial [Acropora cervicornis]
MFIHEAISASDIKPGWSINSCSAVIPCSSANVGSAPFCKRISMVVKTAPLLESAVCWWEQATIKATLLRLCKCSTRKG